MNDVHDRLQPHRLGAAFSLGMALTLLLTTPVGSPSPHPLAPGWLGLLLALTFGSIPLGVMLLVAPSWRGLPIEARRGPALVYLTAALLDLLALAILLASDYRLAWALCLPAAYGLLVGTLYIRLFAVSPAKAADLFP